MRVINTIFFGLVLSLKIVNAQFVSLPDKAFAEKLRLSNPLLIDANFRLDTLVALNTTGVLNISDGKIRNLEGIQYFKNISVLYANDNEIGSFSQVSNLSNLKKIACKNNKLKELFFLTKLSELEELDCALNELVVLPSLDYCLKLRALYAYSNLLEYVPKINHLDSLRILNLFDNKIKELPRTDSIDYLEDVSISKNKIEKMPDFSKNARLKKVLIHVNLLYDAPKKNLPASLTFLVISFNYLSFEDFFDLQSLPNLTDLFFEEQLPIEMPKQINLKEDDTFRLDTKTDTGLNSNQYNWELNQVPVFSSNQPYFDIKQAKLENQGEYQCLITNSQFPNITLKTTKSKIQVNKCIGQSCNDLYFEPNGDGIADEIWLDIVGTIQIVDRFGKKVVSLSGPCFWDGLNQNNEKLPTGLYVLTESNGNTQRIFMVR